MILVKTIVGAVTTVAAGVFCYYLLHVSVSLWFELRLPAKASLQPLVTSRSGGDRGRNGVDPDRVLGRRPCICLVYPSKTLSRAPRRLPRISFQPVLTARSNPAAWWTTIDTWYVATPPCPPPPPIMSLNFSRLLACLSSSIACSHRTA